MDEILDVIDWRNEKKSELVNWISKLNNALIKCIYTVVIYTHRFDLGGSSWLVIELLYDM